MINHPVEYLKVIVDRNNVFYIDENITTIEELGSQGWDMVCVLPNMMFREIEVVKQDRSLYFASSYPNNERINILTTEMIPYHVAIFKRSLWTDIETLESLS